MAPASWERSLYPGVQTTQAAQLRCNTFVGRLGLAEPWITPHALRHTHATRLWEGGMRELALQKRLGHASFESTRVYTRVSDAMMLEDYQRALASLRERKSHGDRD